MGSMSGRNRQKLAETGRVPVRLKVVAKVSAQPITRRTADLAIGREIASQRGKHFDPDLTDLFLNLVPDMMKTHGDIESYLSASGRDNPFIRDRAAINRELRGDGGLFDGRL